MCVYTRNGQQSNHAAAALSITGNRLLPLQQPPLLWFSTLYGLSYVGDSTR